MPAAICHAGMATILGKGMIAGMQHDIAALTEPCTPICTSTSGKACKHWVVQLVQIQPPQPSTLSATPSSVLSKSSKCLRTCRRKSSRRLIRGSGTGFGTATAAQGYRSCTGLRGTSRRAYGTILTGSEARAIGPAAVGSTGCSLRMASPCGARPFAPLLLPSSGIVGRNGVPFWHMPGVCCAAVDAALEHRREGP
jgi:hypothetical protein